MLRLRVRMGRSTPIQYDKACRLLIDGEDYRDGTRLSCAQAYPRAWMAVAENEGIPLP